MTPERRAEIENILTWSGTLPSKLAKDAIRELLGEVDRWRGAVRAARIHRQVCPWCGWVGIDGHELRCEWLAAQDHPK